MSAGGGGGAGSRSPKVNRAPIDAQFHSRACPDPRQPRCGHSVREISSRGRRGPPKINERPGGLPFWALEYEMPFLLKVKCLFTGLNWTPKNAFELNIALESPPPPPLRACQFRCSRCCGPQLPPNRFASPLSRPPTAVPVASDRLVFGHETARAPLPVMTSRGQGHERGLRAGAVAEGGAPAWPWPRVDSP